MSVTLKAAAADDAVFPKPICLSFSGCGFLGLYHVGVAICINEHRHLLRIEKVGGASAGALTGAHLLCGGDFGEVILELFEVATKARSGWLGPFSPNFNIVEHVRDGLRRFLPADAHKICSGRLFISMTRVSDAVNVVVSHYTSREDLIQALICSSFVPVFSGIVPPLFRGRRYWDGGITDNLPKFDSETVTISPFSGVSSICPEDVPQAFVNLNVVNTSFKWSTSNFNRLSRALFPPNPESLRQLVREGYRDALKFVQKITAYIPDEPTPLNEQEQEYFRLKQARQIKRENAAQRNMDKKSTGLENVPASRIQKASAVPPQPQPMETLPSETRSAAAARQRASSDMDTESGVASSTEDDLTAPPLPPHLPSIHVSNLTDAEKIMNAATVLAEHGETNITKLRDAGPYELSVLSRRPSLRSLGIVDHHAAADDDELKSHARVSMQNVAAQRRNITRTYSADDVRLMMSSIRRASPGDVDEDDATSDDDDEREHDRVRRPHRYVQEMPNYLSNALQEACIRDFIAENPYQSNFTILPIPWTLPLELTYSIILSMIEAIPNRSARWWQSASERSYAKRCLLMLRHTLGLVVGQLVRSQDRAAGTIPAVAAAGVVTSGALVDPQAQHEHDETQRRERFLDHVFSHLRHHAPAPVAFVVNKSVGVAHRAVSRSTRVGRKAASYAFGLDRYNTDDDYDYDSDDEYTTCGTDSEAHYTVLSKKRPNAAAAAALNTTITSVSDDEAYAKRREQDVHAPLNLNESHAVAALLGASEVYSSPPPPSTSRKCAAANDDQWFDYDTAYDRDFSRPHFCAGNASSSATMLPPPTIVEEDEAESISGFGTPYSPRPPRSSSSRMAMLSTPVSPSMQRKATGGAKSSPASPRKISYADGLSASSSAEAAAATAAAAAAQLQAAFQKGQHLSSTIRSLNVAGIDDFYGSTSFIRAHPGVPAPAPASNNKRPRSPASADSLEPKRHWVVTPGSALLTSAPAVDRHESTAPSGAPVAARDETDFARSLSGRTRRMHDAAEQARRKTKADTDVDADDEDDVDDYSTNDERSVTRLAAAAASRSEAADDNGGSKNNHERGKVRSSLASLNKTFSSFVSSLYKTTRASHSSD